MEQLNFNRMTELEKLASKYVDEKPENDGFYDAFIAGYNAALRQPPVSVINWVLFFKQHPPDIVQDYIIYDTDGNIKTLEWYEGDSFANCSGGHWSDENGNEVTNVVYWAKKPNVQ
jgi:hypothetical protein